jgi:inosine-uridine nucleoside N-ribohydrolase
MNDVWLDTDIGGDVDDAAALLCAIRHPDIHLIGVSTVLNRVEINTWIAREMLARAGITTIPVLPGAVAPLSGGNAPAGDWLPSHGRLAPELPRATPADDESRIAAIAAAMTGIPEPFHLVAVGPLTNIARLLQHAPDLPDRWLSVRCMGGWIDGDPEYNLSADAPASRLVLDRLAPHLVGLEASTYKLTRQETEEALDPSDPASAFLLDCYREYRLHADWHEGPEIAPLTLFDAITLLSLVRPQDFDFQPLRLTLADDGRLHCADDGAPATYAMSADWDALKPLITALLRGDL